MAKKPTRAPFVETDKLKELRRALTPLQLKFARGILDGCGQSEAYRKASGGRASSETCWVEGHRLMRHPKVAAFLGEYRRCALRPSLLTHAEKRAFIADALRYNGRDCLTEELDIRPELGHLVQEYRVELYPDGKKKKVTVKTVSKGQALLLDNAMAGHQGPEEEDETAGGRAVLDRLAAGGIRPSLALPGELPGAPLKPVDGAVVDVPTWPGVDSANGAPSVG